MSSLTFFGMLSTVNLDRQAVTQANEIEIVTRDGRLAAEMQVAQNLQAYRLFDIVFASEQYYYIAEREPL